MSKNVNKHIRKDTTKNITQSITQKVKEVLHLVWRDVRENKEVILIVALYFFIIGTFFRTSCSLVLTTGYPCPACGMTRAGRSLLAGNFLRAWALHPFIYPVVLLVVVAFVKRYFCKQSLQSLKKWLVILLVFACIFYIYRMYRYFPGEPPISYYRENWLRKIHSFY